MNQPVAKQVPHVWHRPTGDAVDPWAWLRDRDDPDTIAYLEAENAHADAWFAPHTALTQTLFDELKSRVQETDVSVPVRKGEWWYTSRTEEGASYPIHCRGASRETATEVVLIDENLEAQGHDYFSLGIFDVSPDQRWLAWAADLDGSEEYTIRFRDLTTGADIDEVVEGVSTWGGSAWAADSRTFVYMRPDDQMRPAEVWRHTLGTDQSADVLVLDEPDDAPDTAADTATDDTAAAPVEGAVDPVAPTSEAVPAEADLPVQDYDALAASQVVPRLATLSVEELDAVRRYERAHRNRQTILNRVAQLLDAGT